MENLVKDTILRDIYEYMYWDELAIFEKNCNKQTYTSIEVWKQWFNLLSVPRVYLSAAKNFRKAVELYINENLCFCQYDMCSKVAHYLWLDRGFVWHAVEKNCYSIMYAKKYQNDVKIALNSIRYHPYSFQYISHGLRTSKEFIWTAVQNNGNTYRYINNMYKIKS